MQVSSSCSGHSGSSGYLDIIKEFYLDIVEETEFYLDIVEEAEFYLDIVEESYLDIVEETVLPGYH